MGMHIANLAFRPLEGRSGFVVGSYESVDRLSHLLGRGETCPSQSATTQDAEPAFHLIEPTGVGRREVEMDRAMARQPTVMLRFVGIEIVHHRTTSSPAFIRTVSITTSRVMTICMTVRWSRSRR